MTGVELRPPVFEDWRRIHEWASNVEACRYQAWGPNTEEQTRAFVAHAVATWSEDPRRRRYVWTAEAPAIGVVGLGELHVTDREYRQGDVSYAVHPDHWGQGVGTAVGRALLRHGFETEGLHRIVGTCDPRNVASAAVLRKIGMTHEGRARHTLLLRDGWRDSELFSILDHEWSGGTGG